MTEKNLSIHTQSKEPLALLAIGVISLVLSGISPFDRLTWVMEVLPVLIAIPLIIATYRRFPLTPLAYRLILLHALILMLGGHYTYARVPLGLWVQDLFHFARNHYDRLGHFAQGFIPAIIAREILLRTSPLTAELISLGLVEVVADITYKTGYGAFTATAITLSAPGIDSAVITFDVSSTTGLVVDDVIKIDSEFMWVTAIVDANTITVIRDVETNGIHAAAHSTSAAIQRFTLSVPLDVQLAVAMMVAMFIGVRKMNEAGATGVRSFLIGSYSVTYGTGASGAGGSGFPFIPVEAQSLLDSY